MRSFQRRKKTARQNSSSQKSSSQFGPKVLRSVQRKVTSPKLLAPFRPVSNTDYSTFHEMYGHPKPAQVQPQRILGEPGNAIAPQMMEYTHQPGSSFDRGVQRQRSEQSSFGELSRLQDNSVSWATTIKPPVQRQVIQTKLTIGEPGDVHEQQADNVARQVVTAINQPRSNTDQGVQAKQEDRSSLGIQQELGLQRTQEDEMEMKPLDSTVQREEDDEVEMKPLDSTVQREEDDEVEMKPLDSTVQREEDDEVEMKPELGLQRDVLGGGTATPVFEQQVKTAKGGGQALDGRLQEKMGEAMGADFSGVRVHTNTQSHRLNQAVQAKAFTTGQDVFFNQGQYKPASQQGQELIAHELTHVVQQKGVAVQRKTRSPSRRKK